MEQYEILDGEVIEETVEFIPNLDHIPFAGSRYGWCNDGNHSQCRSIQPERQHRDPSRKGYYTLKGSRCPCPCHTRNLD